MVSGVNRTLLAASRRANIERSTSPNSLRRRRNGTVSVRDTQRATRPASSPDTDRIGAEVSATHRSPRCTRVLTTGGLVRQEVDILDQQQTGRSGQLAQPRQPCLGAQFTDQRTVQRVHLVLAGQVARHRAASGAGFARHQHRGASGPVVQQLARQGAGLGRRPGGRRSGRSRTARPGLRIASIRTLTVMPELSTT